MVWKGDRRSEGQQGRGWGDEEERERGGRTCSLMGEFGLIWVIA